ncbi:MAG: hypothetical protein OWS74_07425, partial [Firmicutes bacterium]|nr:hypothetical protein [Bacillota bacterium]
TTHVIISHEYTAPPVVPSSGSLIKTADNPAIYFVANSTAHHIPSATVFNNLGLSWTQIHTVSALPIPITSNESSEPQGLLIQPSGTHAVYLVQHNTAHHIISANEFTALGFSWQSIHSVSRLTYPLGSPYGAPVSNATIIHIAHTPDTYYVFHHILHWIPSATRLYKSSLAKHHIQTVPVLPPTWPVGSPLHLS